MQCGRIAGHVDDPRDHLPYGTTRNDGVIGCSPNALIAVNRVDVRGESQSASLYSPDGSKAVLRPEQLPRRLYISDYLKVTEHMVTAGTKKGGHLIQGDHCP
jgi:hypothetical protein